MFLTKKNEFLSRTELYELNQRMAFRSAHVTPQMDQPSYPLLHLFYHLALEGKLFLSAIGNGSRVTLQPTDRLALYEELSPCEKYFFLLETFWIDTDWRKLQGAYFREPPYNEMPFVLELLSNIPPGREFQFRKGNQWIDNSFGSYFFLLQYFWLFLDYFGFWHVTLEKGLQRKQERNRWCLAESITPTILGVTIAPILQKVRPIYRWNIPYRCKFGEWNIIPGSPSPSEEIASPFKTGIPKRKKKSASLKPIKELDEPFIQPFTSLCAEGELKRTLPLVTQKFVDGIYIFRVALSTTLWRRLEIAADNTLLDLHNTIQKAYNFDDDHLYAFFLDGKAWSHKRFTSPEDEDGPHVDEVRIGELGLFVGQRLLYLFDFGDQWRFSIRLEKIFQDESKPLEPRVIEQKGRNPNQYG